MKQRLVALIVGATLVFGPCVLTTAISSAASASFKATSANMCSLQRLSVTVASGSVALGTEGMLLAFRNRGAMTCDLKGYPKVVAVRPGASSAAIAVPNTMLGGLAPNVTPALISLKPGSSASVVVAGTDNQPNRSSPCVRQRYKTVMVSLPGQTGSKKLSAELPREGTTLPSCSHVQVTPFVEGVAWGLRS